MAEETGTEPFDRLSADPRFQNFAKQADTLFNTSLTEEISKSQNFAPAVIEKKASSAETLVPNGVPSNFKTQSYLGGNFITGPNPGASDARVSSKDYVNQINDMMSNSKAWETKGSEFAKPYSYNAGISNTNFDRYYNHPNFQKLGWTPFRDNEMLYNQNSSWWDDFSRMRGQFLGLAGQGFKSMYGWSAGDNEKFDRELADEFTKKMGVMNSTKGGFGGGLINFAGNAAYTVGIMSSFALEELALLGITAVSAGTLSEVTVPEMIASGARAGRGLFQGAETAAKVAEGFKSTEQIAKGIDNMEKATDLWKYARGLKDFLPLQNTSRYFDEAGKILKSAEEINFNKLKDFAFIAKGPAALYRDLRELNAVMSESRLEGGMVRNEMTQDLVSKHFAETGESPSEDKAKEIYASANEAGTKTTLFNLPAIYLSNKLVFGKMLKGWKPASIALADVGAGIRGTLVTDAGKAEILKGAGKYAKAAYWKQAPSRLIAGTLRYGKANFAEGTQELMQEVISSGAKDYYSKIYSDPNLAGNRQFWASFENGIQDQSNGKGMEVFLSGFFMGSLVQGPQNLIFNTLNEKWTKYSSPEQFQKQKEARESWENSVVNSYNAVTGKGVVPFFNAIEENMVSQVHLESLMNEAEQKDDRKQGVDVQDESLFTQLTTLLKNGSYDHFIDQLKDMKKLSPEELGEAFNRNPEGDNNNKSLSERVDTVIERAEQIRKRYEAMNERFVNPFNPSKYARATQLNEYLNESLDHHAFEQAKKHAIFADYAFDRATERMSSLLNKVAGPYMPLSKANADDITSIFNPTQFQAKLAGLKKEIEVYGTGISTPEQKELAAKLRVKRDSLKNLGGAISRYMTATEKVKLEEMSEQDALAAGSAIIGDLHTAYSSYIKTLGKEVGETVLDKNLTSSFQALVDYIELDHDAKSYAGVINFLHDPENFRTFNRNIRETLATERDRKDETLRAALKEATDRKDKNDLMNALFDEGIWINDFDVEPFKAGDFGKVDFYSIKPLEKIDKGSEKYKTVIAPKLEAYAKVSGKAPSEGSEESTASAIEAELAAVPVPTTGIVLSIGQGRTARFNYADKRWEFRNRKGDVITNIKQIEKLSVRLSNMPNVVSTWWTNNLNNTDRETVRQEFDDLFALYNRGEQSPMDFTTTPELVIMQGIQGIKFKTGADVSKNTTDINEKAWLAPDGRSIDTVAEGLMDDLREVGAANLDESDIINQIYDLVNRFPDGIKNKDIDSYIEDKNPTKDLIKLKRDFSSNHGIDIEIAFNKLSDLNLLNYEDQNETTVTTPETGGEEEDFDQPEEVVTEPTETTTVVPGQIIYATVGAGKSSLAQAYPDKYADGDEILFNHVKTLAGEYNTEGHELIKVPQTVQDSGISFTEFLKTQTPEDKRTLVSEIQQIFRDIANSGKNVLTASWFARDIADKTYIRKDVNDIMEELRKRGRINVKTEAQRILDKEAAYFANKPFEEIPAGMTVQDLLERGKPSLQEGKRLMLDKIEKLSNLEMVDEFENNIMRELRRDEDYLERYGFDGSDITQLLNKKREELSKTITFASVSKGSYLLMRDGILVQVISKNRDKTLTVLYQGDTRESVMTSDQLKSAVKIVTKQNMTETPKNTTEEIQAANENLKNQREFLSDPDARKRAGDEAKGKTKDQSDTDLINSICN